MQRIPALLLLTSLLMVSSVDAKSHTLRQLPVASIKKSEPVVISLTVSYEHTTTQTIADEKST